MNKENLFFEIRKFKIKVKNDYRNKLITKDKYELMCIELGNLVNSLSNGDLLILTTKFHTIKTIYLIMK